MPMRAWWLQETTSSDYWIPTTRDAGRFQVNMEGIWTIVPEINGNVATWWWEDINTLFTVEQQDSDICLPKETMEEVL